MPVPDDTGPGDTGQSDAEATGRSGTVDRHADGTCHTTRVAQSAHPLHNTDLLPEASPEDEWPQWLGPNREPVWHATGILSRFPDGGPPLRWATPIGSGYSGPAVTGGRVFVMDRSSDANLNDGEVLHEDPPKNANFLRRRLPGNERVLCMDESTGKILWSHEYECDYSTVALYAIGPRCTPTVDGDFVYTLGAEGKLTCLQIATGKLVWSRDFTDDYGVDVPEWGFAGHPLVDEELLICVVGGRGTTCVAFDKHTGEQRWSALTSSNPGYCPPVIHEIGDERHLVIWHGDAVEGLNPQTGEVYWSVPFKATYGMSIGAPQIEGRSLYIMCYNRQSALIKIEEDNRSARIVWEGSPKTGIGGVLNTAIMVDGHVYACGHGGQYSCASLGTGERLWSTFAMSDRGRRSSWGNVFTIRNHDRYFHANDVGDLIIARMTPEGFDEISRARLIEPTHAVGGRKLVWSHPAFANRSVYLRNDREIRCYSLAAPEPARP